MNKKQKQILISPSVRETIDKGWQDMKIVINIPDGVSSKKAMSIIEQMQDYFELKDNNIK